MNQIFIKNMRIDKVRHLKNINIQISENECRHIILTGKNGSGKTSVLDAIAIFINSITTGTNPAEVVTKINDTKERIEFYVKTQNEDYLQKDKDNLKYLTGQYINVTAGMWLDFNTSFTKIQKEFEAGRFIVAYYKADRVFSSVEPKHVEKVQLKSEYMINEMPRTEFIKYLLD